MPNIQVINNDFHGRNDVIGSQYEIRVTTSQTSYGQKLKSGLPTLEIEVSITSNPTYEWSETHIHRTVLILRCLNLLNRLYTDYPEGLEEALETLDSMVEYYGESRSNLQMTSLPQELKVFAANVLPSTVRPPLIIDFE